MGVGSNVSQTYADWCATATKGDKSLIANFVKGAYAAYGCCAVGSYVGFGFAVGILKPIVTTKTRGIPLSLLTTSASRKSRGPAWVRSSPPAPILRALRIARVRIVVNHSQRQQPGLQRQAGQQQPTTTRLTLRQDLDLSRMLVASLSEIGMTTTSKTKMLDPTFPKPTLIGARLQLKAINLQLPISSKEHTLRTDAVRLGLDLD